MEPKGNALLLLSGAPPKPPKPAVADAPELGRPANGSLGAVPPKEALEEPNEPGTPNADPPDGARLDEAAPNTDASPLRSAPYAEPNPPNAGAPKEAPPPPNAEAVEVVMVESNTAGTFASGWRMGCWKEKVVVGAAVDVAKLKDFDAALESDDDEEESNDDKVGDAARFVEVAEVGEYEGELGASNGGLTRLVEMGEMGE